MARRIFLLDGPSCTGKTTLVQGLLAGAPGLRFCPRVTTRAPRGPESDYRFVTAEEFAEMRAAGRLAAWRSFDFGMSYGLPRDEVEAALAAEQDALALIDLGTLEQARRSWPEAVGVFLMAPLDELRQRLIERGVNTPEQIEERLHNAEQALAQALRYDYLVLNRQGRQAEALEQLRWIVGRP